MNTFMEYKKKLIEEALPLEAINTESAREKSIRHGHPADAAKNCGRPRYANIRF